MVGERRADDAAVAGVAQLLEDRPMGGELGAGGSEAVLGGAEGVFREALIASAREHIWYDAARDLPIERAHFGAESGIIGAALAAER